MARRIILGTVCRKCRRLGHDQQTIALDTSLFKRNVTAAGVSFTKKPHKFLSFKNYICQASTAEFFSQEVSRARAEYAAADEALNAAAARRTDLVANIAEAVAPVSSTVSALVAAESSAAALAPQNVAATREQAECADLGLSAVASALSGAITASTGRPSGITSDDAPAAALATLSGRQQAAERVGAKRLRDAAIGLSAPSGSDRLNERRARHAAGPEPVLPPRPRSPRRLRLSPSEAAMDLAEFIFQDETGEQREAFLGLVTDAANKYGIRGSTLGGSADVNTVTEQLLSGIDATDLARSSYIASCGDWIRMLRAPSS
ncbi:hypothetical protein I4F81_007925 [Pyropia yezoensis]|uniref:Uncharacterized protein n=1 Tax=Pyropia yezoensis TaxID=2788 RepID=A0ACC3C682_PYRYE|nr:hypothetical protein I4F81_007925 [Neopyropia yezoensis]